MIPDYPQFKPFSLDDLPELSRRIKLLQIEDSELMPSTLFIWQDTKIPTLTRINGNLCIHIKQGAECFFLEPLGDHDLEGTLKICLDHAGAVSRISDRLASLSSLCSNRPSPIPDHFDYLYRCRDLAEMKGRPYDGKRNHIKRFKSRFPDWSFQPLEAIHKDAAIALFNAWVARKGDSVHLHSLNDSSQRQALTRTFSAYDHLGLSGGCIVAQDRMLGFILGCPLSEDTLVVHFQYGHPDASGIMPLLLQEAAKSTFSAWEHLNLEQDVGIAGLRKSKLSYHPIRLIKKYHLSPMAHQTACG